jgi:hypothetical protein
VASTLACYLPQEQQITTRSDKECIAFCLNKRVSVSKTGLGAFIIISGSQGTVFMGIGDSIPSEGGITFS